MSLYRAQAHVYGNNINTDLIIAGKYTKTLDMRELASHCLEDLDANFTAKVNKGDFLVAGSNFGCGSSREQAPLALKYAGVEMIIATSFARIFYRNAVNIGLPLLVCDTSSIRDLDILEVDTVTGIVTVNDKTRLQAEPLPDFMMAILEQGGLVPYISKFGDFIVTK
jgi:3-isopropylmalate/(R)-2-methylmalate dehydratase small subunit